MKGFSIRRHKRNASDSATIVTEDPPLSSSQRSVYGSVMSSRNRNRLHKPHHSLDETHDPQTDAAERPRRKLLKKTRQQQPSDSPSEERISVTPPEQKAHGSSLSVTFDHHIVNPDREWAGDGYSSAGHSMAPYISMRHSVGSSADVLLTPIRGSTVIADDFVFLPTSHAVEIGEPDELASSSGYETPESPGPTITTLLTESEIHYGAERESLGSEAENLGPDANLGGLVIPNNKPDGELRPSDSSFVLPEPPTPETPTVANPIFKHRHTRLATPPEPAALPSAPPTPKPSPPPAIEVVKCPVPRAPLPTPPPTVRAPSSTRQSAKNVEPRNVVPFPVGRPQSIAFSSTDAAPYSPPSEIYQHPLTVWIFAAWDTTTGIIILAMECYRWLARKGMRGDFRSCMSVWFLREVTLGLFLPLLLAAVTLWWLLRTSYPSDSLSSMSV